MNRNTAAPNRVLLGLFLVVGLFLPLSCLAAQCSFPDDLRVIRSDDRNKRLFVEGTETEVASAKMTHYLSRLNRVIERCEPSWEGKWSASFFSDRKLAGYKTDSVLSKAVESGDWGRAYVAEYDRETQVLTILPLDPGKRRTRHISLLPVENANRYFKEDGGVQATYIRLDSNGTYRVTAREHMFVRVEESGHWKKDGTRIAFTPIDAAKPSYEVEEVSYKNRIFLALKNDDGPSIPVPVEEIKKSLDQQDLPLYVFFEITAGVYGRETKETYPFHFRPEVRH